jgi:hypothetical protein
MSVAKNPRKVKRIRVEKSKKEQKVTGLAGLIMYMEQMRTMGLWQEIEKDVQVSGEDQGWTDMEMVIFLVLLNLAGGTSTSDIEKLEQDDGLRKVLKNRGFWGLNQKQIQELEKRWRILKKRAVASEGSVRRYLKKFHSEEEEERRKAKGAPKAFIPRMTAGLSGLNKLIAFTINYVQRALKLDTATLNMDATIIRSEKDTAMMTYKGFRGYQPFNVQWDETEMMVYTEFRDGNVPAGYEQKRVLEASLDNLPEDIKTVRVRSDSAGYQHDLMRYMEKGENERFGRIEFAISCDVTAAFRQAVCEVPEDQWHDLNKLYPDGDAIQTGRQWAEVVYVPNEIAHSKDDPEYRYIAIRTPVQTELFDQQQPQQGTLNFDTHRVRMSTGSYRVFGVVTNMDWDGETLINWHRQRAGKGEEIQAVMKTDMAGGIVPVHEFGGNAAWWMIAALASNINQIMKIIALPVSWRSHRMKAIRFKFINLAAHILQRGHDLVIKFSSQKLVDIFLQARERMRLLPVPLC